MPVWGHGGTYSTAKHGDPRASTYAGLRPMDLVSQLSFVALSRGKVMLKHTINSRHCLGGFSVSSLMQCFQFTLDFTWWSSWRLRSSPNRYDTTPGKNVLSPPHWHSRPKFLFTRTALKSIQNQNSPRVPWFIFFFAWLLWFFKPSPFKTFLKWAENHTFYRTLFHFKYSLSGSNLG